MQIREGRPDDVPRALEIWRTAVDATHGFLTPQDRAEIDVMVAEDFLPNVELWLAVDAGDRPLGFLVMSIPAASAGYGRSRPGPIWAG